MSPSVKSPIGKMLERFFRSLPPEVARSVAEYKGDEEIEREIESLARKANEGELSPEEHEEYAAYIRAGNILATMQAIARRTLDATTGPERVT